MMSVPETEFYRETELVRDIYHIYVSVFMYLSSYIKSHDLDIQDLYQPEIKLHTFNSFVFLWVYVMLNKMLTSTYK